MSRAEKTFWAGIVLTLGIAGIYAVTNVLSSDAVAMAIGVLLGILAGIPVSLLVLASQPRQSTARTEEARADYTAAPYIVDGQFEVRD